MISVLCMEAKELFKHRGRKCLFESTIHLHGEGVVLITERIEIIDYLRNKPLNWLLKIEKSQELDTTNGVRLSLNDPAP